LCVINQFGELLEASISNDNEINVKMLSGAVRSHFPFTCKPGINVDLEDSSKLLEYFELFCTPEISEVIARETN
jgi:hypothetical protein